MTPALVRSSAILSAVSTWDSALLPSSQPVLKDISGWLPKFTEIAKKADFNFPQTYYGASPSVVNRVDRAVTANAHLIMPFIPAGYPDLAATEKLLPAMESAGANIIEVGIPFSDPIADGPVIQEAFTAALAKKLKLAEVFACVRKARSGVSIPLVAMVSYSIAFRQGIERFAGTMKESGFDGLILPDLPPPEAMRSSPLLPTVVLLTPGIHNSAYFEHSFLARSMGFPASRPVWAK